MLVVGLNDELKNQHAQVEQLDLCLFCKNQTLASNDDLTGYSSFCVCLITNGAKDGIFGALQLVSRFKGPFLIPQHHLVEHYSPTTQIHEYVQASTQTLSTYAGGANATIWGS